MVSYECGSSRNKRKDKARKKKENPYKLGGRFRTFNVNETSNKTNSSKKKK